MLSVATIPAVENLSSFFEHKGKAAPQGLIALEQSAGEMTAGSQANRQPFIEAILFKPVQLVDYFIRESPAYKMPIHTQGTYHLLYLRQ